MKRFFFLFWSMFGLGSVGLGSSLLLPPNGLVVTYTPAPPTPIDLAMNVGGSQYTSPTSGEIFQAESGVTVTSGSVHVTGAAITNTTDDAVFQTQRWGVFSILIDVPNASYDVTLGLAENYAPKNGSGLRENSFTINGVTVLNNYDIQDPADNAGQSIPQYAAVEKTFATTATGGTGITVATVDNGIDLPTLAYIRVRSTSAVAPLTPVLSGTAGDTQIAFSWPLAAGAVSYNLRWGTSTGVYPNTETNVVSGFVLPSLTNGTAIFAVLDAVNGAGTTTSDQITVTPVAAGGDGIALYVATTGSDAAAGTIGAPLKTLEGARNRLRVLTNRTTDGVSTPTPAGGWAGATITFAPGTYSFVNGDLTTYPVATDERDGGTSAFPVIYRGAGAIWTGAYQIPDWQATTTAAGAFVVGARYKIATAGTTTWTSIGSANNTVGTIFTATGAGSGTGTAFNPYWQIVTSAADSTNYNKLPVASRGKTYKFDVSSVAAINANKGTLDQGYNGPGNEAAGNNQLRLIDDGKMPDMSRWPNVSSYDGEHEYIAGWVPVLASNTTTSTTIQWADVPGTGGPASWGYSVTAPPTYTRFYGAWSSNYLHNWKLPTLIAASPTSGRIRITTANSQYASSKFQGTGHFIALRNFLEALDDPGDYVWDQGAGRLYYRPYTDTAPTETAVTLADAILRIGTEDQPTQATNYITFQDLTIEGSRNGLVRVYDSNTLKFDNCELRHVGGILGPFYGENMTNFTMLDSSVHHCTLGGIVVHGGNPVTLTQANNLIDGCDVYNMQFEAHLGSHPVISPMKDNVSNSGLNHSCGLTIKDTTVRNSHGIGIYCNASYLTMDNITVDGVLATLGDRGALTSEFRFTNVHNVIKNSTFRNLQRLGSDEGAGVTYLGSTGGYNVGFYMDIIWGWTVEDNVFDNVEHAINLAAGKHHIIRRNKFINTGAGHYDAADILCGQRYGHTGNPLASLDANLNAFPLTSAPWSTEFPTMKDYRVGGTRRAVILYPEGHVIVDNMSTDGVIMPQIKARDVMPHTRSGFAVGNDWNQLQYPIGATGTPTAGGGTVTFRSIAALPSSTTGTLTTRTNNTTGTITGVSGHGVTTGMVMYVEWTASGGGSQTGVIAGTVSGNSIPISSGVGTNLPNTGTVVTVLRPVN